MTFLRSIEGGVASEAATGALINLHGPRSRLAGLPSIAPLRRRWSFGKLSDQVSHATSRPLSADIFPR